MCAVRAFPPPASAHHLALHASANLFSLTLARGHFGGCGGDCGRAYGSAWLRRVWRGRIHRVRTDLPDWERLLAAERHLQELAPSAVLVGGTAAALHAGHRVSEDGDHVLGDLRERFDEVLRELESAAGWRTARVRRPVLILGQMDGILTGIRQLRRTAPLETEQIEGLTVPTLAEMARIKAWLLATRHTVRDYLDTVVLLERLGEPGVIEALRTFDALYAQASGASPLSEVAERLAAGSPGDLAEVDLRSYRGLVEPFNDWSHLTSLGQRWAPVVAGVALSAGGPT